MQRALSRRMITLGLAGLAGLAGLGACGTARVLHQTEYEGVIELQGDHNKAMEQANEEMAAHCGLSNFTVVRDGLEPIGPEHGDRPDTAWRVHYECGDGPPTRPAPVPPSTVPGYR